MESRAQIFDQLEQPNQDLLLRIYGTRENYIRSAYEYPIEKYIIAYDTVMSDGDILPVYNLSIRLGAKALPSDQNVNVFLYNVFEEYLDFELGTPVLGLPRPSEMINMDKDRYYHYAKDNLNLADLDLNFGDYYDQRLRDLFQSYRAS
jgi:hypothetical protein